MNVRHILPVLSAADLGGGFAPAGAEPERRSDADVRRVWGRGVTAGDAGHCSSPYSIAPNGGRCGGRSASVRPRGAAPLHSPSDVTANPIAAWRRR
jgi:hypothetical protein